MSGDRTGDNHARSKWDFTCYYRDAMRGGAKDGSFDVPAVILVTIVNVNGDQIIHNAHCPCDWRKFAPSSTGIGPRGRGEGQAGWTEDRALLEHILAEEHVADASDKLPEEPSARLSLGSPVGFGVAAASHAGLGPPAGPLAPSDRRGPFCRRPSPRPIRRDLAIHKYIHTHEWTGISLRS